MKSFYITISLARCAEILQQLSFACFINQTSKLNSFLYEHFELNMIKLTLQAFHKGARYKRSQLSFLLSGHEIGMSYYPTFSKCINQSSPEYRCKEFRGAKRSLIMRKLSATHSRRYFNARSSQMERHTRKIQDGYTRITNLFFVIIY